MCGLRLTIALAVGAALAGAASGVSLPKCCPDGMMGFPECVNSSDPILYPFLPWNDLPTYVSNISCSSYTFLDSSEYSVGDTGDIVLKDDPSESGPIKKDSYCFDVRGQIAAIMCLEEYNTKVPTPYPIGMIISIPFLAATAIIYTVIRKLRNLPGRCLVFQCTSLSLAYTSLATANLFPDIEVTKCAMLGFAVQFFFLATFFWLNVMCFDIYWAFSELKLLGGSAGPRRDQWKLLCYSAYAWGMPLLILCVTIAVDYSPSIPETSRFKPDMGKDRCSFQGRTAGWTYFYGPMAVILLINCLLFVMTAFHLFRHKKDAGITNRGDSRKHGGRKDKERFNVYLTLFLMMGINWLAEVVSFTFENDVPRYLWYLTDITNTLQGVFIFLIFAWKQRVRQLIWDKLCKGNRSGSTANNTSSTSITTNSTRSHHNSIKMANINNVATAPINCGSDVDDDENDQN